MKSELVYRKTWACTHCSTQNKMECEIARAKDDHSYSSHHPLHWWAVCPWRVRLLANHYANIPTIHLWSGVGWTFCQTRGQVNAPRDPLCTSILSQSVGRSVREGCAAMYLHHPTLDQVAAQIVSLTLSALTTSSLDHPRERVREVERDKERDGERRRERERERWREGEGSVVWWWVGITDVKSQGIITCSYLTALHVRIHTSMAHILREIKTREGGLHLDMWVLLINEFCGI